MTLVLASWLLIYSQSNTPRALESLTYTAVIKFIVKIDLRPTDLHRNTAESRYSADCHRRCHEAYRHTCKCIEMTQEIYRSSIPPEGTQINWTYMAQFLDEDLNPSKRRLQINPYPMKSRLGFDSTLPHIRISLQGQALSLH